MKKSEKLTVFRCFKRVEKGYIESKWVKGICDLYIYLVFTINSDPYIVGDEETEKDIIRF